MAKPFNPFPPHAKAAAIALASGLALTACATTQDDIATSPPPDGECNAASAQSIIGQQATAAVGQRLLALTGARQLRWVPPDTAVTMDFRHDRLTVSYDRAIKIERISCG